MTFIDEENLKREMLKYEENMKTILVDEKNMFDYVPNTLYHGSPESLDVINSVESTQNGKYVYTTDNPIKSLLIVIVVSLS